MSKYIIFASHTPLQTLTVFFNRSILPMVAAIRRKTRNTDTTNRSTGLRSKEAIMTVGYRQVSQMLRVGVGLQFSPAHSSCMLFSTPSCSGSSSRGQTWNARLQLLPDFGLANSLFLEVSFCLVSQTRLSHWCESLACETTLCFGEWMPTCQVLPPSTFCHHMKTSHSNNLRILGVRGIALSSLDC